MHQAVAIRCSLHTLEQVVTEQHSIGSIDHLSLYKYACRLQVYPQLRYVTEWFQISLCNDFARQKRSVSYFLLTFIFGIAVMINMK